LAQLPSMAEDITSDLSENSWLAEWFDASVVDFGPHVPCVTREAIRADVNHWREIQKLGPMGGYEWQDVYDHLRNRKVPPGKVRGADAFRVVLKTPQERLAEAIVAR